ncbi:protein arginine kinase activator [Clostridium algifaecis]|uniref:Protein arginine kinase activator n=1 Tax=Clostridium algifaecis TaxID=1472040 RepID=A0ABS4KSX7_9CLOT|nr:UvrB/UvrC motif-containing protein [Clostridium algifaecis]MBP2033153.1 protein arginine kinase activator [Clostridium algifaecis]
MLCDICKKNEATVHITKIVNGAKQDINLCEKCAMEHGELSFVPQIDFVSPFSFQNILSGIMNYMNNTSTTQDDFDITCKNCGTSYREFKKTGLVGCSECYDNFSSILQPIIKRVQANLEHTGKIPKRAGKNIIERRNLLKLKQDLQKAITLEEYEKAAEIRDKIKNLQNNSDNKEEGE